MSPTRSTPQQSLELTQIEPSNSSDPVTSARYEATLDGPVT
jgi:hypothetical protein